MDNACHWRVTTGIAWQRLALTRNNVHRLALMGIARQSGRPPQSRTDCRCEAAGMRIHQRRCLYPGLLQSVPRFPPSTVPTLLTKCQSRHTSFHKLLVCNALQGTSVPTLPTKRQSRHTSFWMSLMCNFFTRVPVPTLPSSRQSRHVTFCKLLVCNALQGTSVPTLPTKSQSSHA